MGKFINTVLATSLILNLLGCLKTAEFEMNSEKVIVAAAPLLHNYGFSITKEDSTIELYTNSMTYPGSPDHYLVYDKNDSLIKDYRYPKWSSRVPELKRINKFMKSIQGIQKPYLKRAEEIWKEEKMAAKKKK